MNYFSYTFRFVCAFLVYIALHTTGDIQADVRVQLPPTITLRVQPEDAVFGRPTKAQVTIISTQDQQISENSFTLNNQPVKLDLVMEQKKAPQELFSPDDPDALVVRTYTLSLGPLPEGIQTVGPLVLQLNGMRIESNTVSFRVEGAKVSDRFQLFLKVRPETTFYPGQEVTFEYQILFYDPIQLTHEKLSLFEIDWAQLIGTPEMKNELQGSATIQRILQKAYLQNEGTYEIPTSTIEGFVQRKDPLGNIQLVPPLLRAQAPALRITVNPFPETTKPADFMGAIGIFTLRGRVKDESIELGKPFVLEITASGRGEYQTLHLPNLQTDPNFSDRFLIRQIESGQPEEGATKQFLIELIPISYVTQIPEISFSSFDPSTKRYVPVKLQPTPIKMEIPQEAGQKPTLRGAEQLPPLFPGPYETRTIPYSTIILTSLVCGTILLITWRLKPKNRPSTPSEKPETAYRLMLEGIKKRKTIEKSFPIIKRALLQELKEAGLVEELPGSPEILSSEGVIGEVKQIVRKLDERLYTVVKNPSSSRDAQLYHEAITLFHKIHKGSQNE